MADYNLRDFKGMSGQFTPVNGPRSTAAFQPKWSETPVPVGPGGKPLGTEFVTVGNSDTGMLQNQYNLYPQMDMRTVDAGRTEALRDPATMSRWGQMALSQAQNQNAAMMSGQQQQAQNQLAMQGGLRTGARERLASQGMQQQLRGNQAALGGVQMQDEANRQKWLQTSPGNELQAAQYNTNLQDKNISRALTEVNVGRSMQQNQFNEAMRAWAAEQSGQTMVRAAEEGTKSGGLLGSGGILGTGLKCFLTTACVGAMGLEDNCWVLDTARKFRDTFMAQTPERAREITAYYEYAPTIVEGINKRQDALKVWKKLFWEDIVPFVESAGKNELEKAHERYKRLIEKARELSGMSA